VPASEQETAPPGIESITP